MTDFVYAKGTPAAATLTGKEKLTTMQGGRPVEVTALSLAELAVTVGGAAPEFETAAATSVAETLVLTDAMRNSIIRLDASDNDIVISIPVTLTGGAAEDTQAFTTMFKVVDAGGETYDITFATGEGLLDPTFYGSVSAISEDGSHVALTVSRGEADVTITEPAS